MPEPAACLTNLLEVLPCNPQQIKSVTELQVRLTELSRELSIHQTGHIKPAKESTHQCVQQADVDAVC